MRTITASEIKVASWYTSIKVIFHAEADRGSQDRGRGQMSRSAFARWTPWAITANPPTTT